MQRSKSKFGHVCVPVFGLCKNNNKKKKKSYLILDINFIYVIIIQSMT